MSDLILTASQLLLLLNALNRGGRELLGLPGPLDPGHIQVPQGQGGIRGRQVDVGVAVQAHRGSPRTLVPRRRWVLALRDDRVAQHGLVLGCPGAVQELGLLVVG